LQDSNAKKVAAQMISYVESLKLFLNKSSLSGRDSAGLASVGDLADKILESFSELQDIQYDQSKADNKRIKRIIDETKRNMMITLIIGFLGTIILGLVVPGKIALPFKKIRDAIRELQDCNFDVSIYYNQDDEIGEIAREMNKMIHSFKIFDGLRADRINVERRKFDALANMVKKPVLVANAMGEVIYMNSKVYGLMNVQSEDVIGKNMLQTPLDPSVIESFELAIKRRSKIENAEIQITAKREASSESELNQIQDQVNELGETIQGAGLPDEVVFSGFANVVPIRGKESSLDYYLMVLSNEVFA
jgi:signal transduction histidine kinase